MGADIHILIKRYKDLKQPQKVVFWIGNVVFVLIMLWGFWPCFSNSSLENVSISPEEQKEIDNRYKAAFIKTIIPDSLVYSENIPQKGNIIYTTQRNFKGFLQGIWDTLVGQDIFWNNASEFETRKETLSPFVYAIPQKGLSRFPAYENLSVSEEVVYLNPSGASISRTEDGKGIEYSKEMRILGNILAFQDSLKHDVLKGFFSPDRTENTGGLAKKVYGIHIVLAFLVYVFFVVFLFFRPDTSVWGISSFSFKKSEEDVGEEDRSEIFPPSTSTSPKTEADLRKEAAEKIKEKQEKLATEEKARKAEAQRKKEETQKAREEQIKQQRAARKKAEREKLEAEDERIRQLAYAEVKKREKEERILKEKQKQKEEEERIKVETERQEAERKRKEEEAKKAEAERKRQEVAYFAYRDKYVEILEQLIEGAIDFKPVDTMKIGKTERVSIQIDPLRNRINQKINLSDIRKGGTFEMNAILIPQLTGDNFEIEDIGNSQKFISDNEYFKWYCDVNPKADGNHGLRLRILVIIKHKEYPEEIHQVFFDKRDINVIDPQKELRALKKKLRGYMRESMIKEALEELYDYSDNKDDRKLRTSILSLIIQNNQFRNDRRTGPLPMEQRRDYNRMIETIAQIIDELKK